MSNERYKTTPVAKAISEATYWLRNAISAAEFEQRWAATLNPQAAEVAAGEVARLRAVYEELRVLATSPLCVRPAEHAEDMP